MSATWALGQLTPETRSSVYKPLSLPQWEPIDDLEVRDSYSRKIRCLGVTTRDARCRWDTDNYALRSCVPQLEDTLTRLSQKSPRDVTDGDLWDLLHWGTCDRHGSCETSAKSKGFADLKARLAVVQTRRGMVQETRVKPYQSQDLSNSLYQRSIELEQSRTSILALQTQLDNAQNNAAIQLRSQTLRIQEQEAKCSALDDQVHQLTIKTENLEDTVKELRDHNASQALMINQPNPELNDARRQIIILQASLHEKDQWLSQVNRTLEIRDSQLKQIQSTDQTQKEWMQDKISNIQRAFEMSQSEQESLISRYQAAEQECATLRAQAQDHQNERARQTSQIKSLTDALESERRARTTRSTTKTQTRTQTQTPCVACAKHIKNHDDVRSTNEVLLHELEHLTANRDAAVTERDELTQQLDKLKLAPAQEQKSTLTTATKASAGKRKGLSRLLRLG